MSVDGWVVLKQQWKIVSGHAKVLDISIYFAPDFMSCVRNEMKWDEWKGLIQRKRNFERHLSRCYRMLIQSTFPKAEWMCSKAKIVFEYSVFFYCNSRETCVVFLLFSYKAFWYNYNEDSLLGRRWFFFITQKSAVGTWLNNKHSFYRRFCLWLLSTVIKVIGFIAIFQVVTPSVQNTRSRKWIMKI